jgi:Mg-chelatase subunit ChlD
LVVAVGGRTGRAGAGGRGGIPRVTTDESAELVALPDARAVDPEVRARVRQIARRLSVPRPPRDRRARRGVGELTSVPWSGGSDELDLERTLEALAGTPVPDPEDLVVRERRRRTRSVVLAVDVSGSMRGERVRTAAATVGALAGGLARDRLAVIAFWSDAAVLVPLGRAVSPGEVLDLLLRLPAEGLTNVAFPLEVAGRMLAGVPARDARVLLLSDCVHNAGPDPRGAAARLPRLDVLLDASGEQDVELGRELAAAGRGRCRVVREHRDVAAALGRVFAD